MHPCPGGMVAVGRAVVNYVRAAHAHSAGSKYRHSTVLPARASYVSHTTYIYSLVCLKFDRPSKRNLRNHDAIHTN